MPPQRILILDIDGLRRDVFEESLADPAQPALSALLGAPERRVVFDPLSTSPSITFCAQSSMFTGRHPADHGVIGNQFFDRFGRYEGRGPKFYAFDVGDLLAVEDALRIYMDDDGLLGRVYPIGVTTLHEHVRARGKRSVTVHHMVGRGADLWIKPDLLRIARAVKGGGFFSLQPATFDSEMTDKAIALLRRGDRPDVLTLYFIGLDQFSHHFGPGQQLAYMREQIHPALARLYATLEELGLLDGLLTVVASDHGQIATPSDTRHSLRLSFPFDRQLAHVFDSLGLDVHDYPGETPDCDAVVASNGGLAYVYLRHPRSPWSDAPRFNDDVLRVGKAFWDAHCNGTHSRELQGALAAVLVRNVEADGWASAFQSLETTAQLAPLEAAFAAGEGRHFAQAAKRLRACQTDLSPDLILVSNYPEGFYFSPPLLGMHGGLHPEDSRATLAYGFAREDDQAAAVLNAVQHAIEARSQAEDRAVSVVDLSVGVLAALDA